jgi:transcription antitermination factor NusG
VNHGPNLQPEEYSVGHRVRIVDGPLAGVEGVIRRTKDTFRITVGITILQRAVSAEVDYTAVLPLAYAS